MNGAARTEIEIAGNLTPFRNDLKTAEGLATSSGRTIGQKFSDVGSTLTRTLMPAAAAIGAVFAKAFSEWDTGFDAIRVGTGATGKELEKLGASMKRVGGQVTQPLSEVGKVMGDLATRTGLTGRPLENLTKQILDLARITGTDAQASVAGITRVFGDWSVKTGDQSKTLDMLFRASQLTGIGVDELSNQVVTFGGPLRQMGFSLGESAALLGKFEKEGVVTSRVLGGLRIALGTLAREGIKDPAKAFQELTARIKGARTEGDATRMAMELFGSRAGPEMAIAIREGRLELGNLFSQVTKGKETIKAATADTTDYGDKFAMLRNKLYGVIGPVGEVGAAIAGMVAAAGPALMGIGTIMDTKVGKAFGKMVASATKAAASVVAAVARQVAAWALLGAKSMLHAAKVAAAWLLAMGPIPIIIALIVGLIILIIKNWEKIKEKTKQIWSALVAWVKEKWQQLKDKAAEIWNMIKDKIANAVQAVKDKLADIWNAIKQKVVDVWNAVKERIAGAWDSIKERISNAVSSVKEALANAWNAIKERVAAAWDAVKERVGNAWDRIKEAVRNAVGNVIDFIKELPGRILSALGNLGSLLFNAGADIIRGLLNGIKNGLTAVWNEVKAIGGKIAALKGPLDYDRKLLVPAGEAIMGGLVAGIDSEMSSLRAKLADVTDMLRLQGQVSVRGPMLAPAGARAGAGSPTTVNHYNVREVVLPNIRGAVMAEEFFDGIRQTVRQGVRQDS